MVWRIWISSPGCSGMGGREASTPCVAEFAGLVADRLGAGVELVEVLVGGLRDHERALACCAVGVRGIERGVFGLALLAR